MELKKNPNAKRHFCPLTFEVYDASFVSLIKMLRLLTNNCPALSSSSVFTADCLWQSIFSPAACRDSKKIQP
jgi:hypothetical protein